MATGLGSILLARGNPDGRQPVGILSKLLVVALLLMLGGCNTVHYAKDPLKGRSTAQDGTVLVSITVNTGEVAAFSTIVLTRDQDSKSPMSKTYTLTNIGGTMSRDTALFLGDLPAGDYRLIRLLAPNNKYIELSFGQGEIIGAFKVESGKLTDLGRMVLTAINIKVILGRSPTVLDNRQLVTDLAPTYTSILNRPAASQTWAFPRKEQDIAEDYAKVYPIGTAGLTELASGEVVGGSRMGTVLARNTEGRWRVLARTGRLDAVMATSSYAKGDNLIVVGGDLGTLMRIDKTGKAYPIARGNLPFGAYIFVDHAADYSAWVVGVQTDKTASLYVSPTLENGAWTLMKTDTILPSAWSGGRGVWMWAAPGLVGFASTEKGQVECYDYKGKRWQGAQAPDGRRLIGLAGGPGQGVGVLTGGAGGLAGVFAKTHYTLKCGGPWTETHSPYKVKMSPPVLLPSGSIIEGGGAFGDKGLYRSADRGQTWNKVTSDVTIFNDRLWVMPKAGMFAVSSGTLGIESVERSADDGQTWKLELTSINRQLLDKQLKRK